MRTTRVIGLQSAVTRVSGADSAGFQSFSSKNNAGHMPSGLIKSNPIEKSRSLVAVDRPKQFRATPGKRIKMSAPLIAQLIATRLEMPQTRVRRRASLASASEAYGNVGSSVRPRGKEGVSFELA